MDILGTVVYALIVVFHERTMNMKNGRKYGIVIAAVVIQFVAVGLGYGFSVMFAEIINVFSSRRSTASLLQGIYFLMSFGGGILWNGVIERFNTGPASIFGIIVATAGLFFSSFATQTGTIIALAGILCGAGMSVGFLSTFITATMAFKEDPRFLLTCLSLATGLGQITVPLIFEVAIANYFWSGAFQLAAGLVLQCLPFGILMWLCSVHDCDRKGEETPRPIVVFDMTVLKDFILCQVLINILLMLSSGNIEAFFIVDQLVSSGSPRTKGSIMMSVLGLSNVLGRALTSIIVLKCKKWPLIYHWFYMCVMIAVGHGLVLMLQDVYILLIPACVVQGISYGAFFAQVPTVIYEIVGSDRYPAAIAILNIVIGCSDLLSCILGGVIRDTMGSYDMVYYIAIGSTVYVTVSSLFVAYLVRNRDRKTKSELINVITSKTNYSTLN